MRLLECSNTGEFSLTKDLIGDDVPRSYAILSHTLGPHDDEMTFKDLKSDAGTGKSGYHKIRFCEEYVKRDGL
jgi:hypothetical protein